MLARLRSGANSLRVETGRRRGVIPSDRLCWFGCGEVEDEYHFLIRCSMYDDFRQEFISLLGRDRFLDSGFCIMLGKGSRQEIDLAIRFIKMSLARRKRLLSMMQAG